MTQQINPIPTDHNLFPWHSTGHFWTRQLRPDIPDLSLALPAWTSPLRYQSQTLVSPFESLEPFSFPWFLDTEHCLLLLESVPFSLSVRQLPITWMDLLTGVPQL